ncbi:MAG: M48 family metallopeptidase [Candidatus Cryptobacteroides sp.]
MAQIDKLFNDSEFGLVRITRSSRSRRISLRVKGRKGRSGERLSVTVPYLTGFKAGLDFLESHREWVRKAFRAQDSRIGRAGGEGRAVLGIRDGFTVPTLVAEIVFLADGGLADRAVVKCSSEDGKALRTIRFPETWLGEDGAVNDPAKVDWLKNVLAEVLRKDAKVYLVGRLAELASRYGFTYHRVTVKHNVSNWGCCSSKDNISLNLNLMRLPKPLCDYVLLHELCHLRERNHGPAFHSMLEKLCRDNLEHLVSEGCEEAAQYLDFPSAGQALSRAVAGWVIF